MLLQDVINEYKQSGFQVITNPSGATLPDSLRFYLIDAIAYNKNELWAIVCRSKNTLSSNGRMDLKGIYEAAKGNVDLIVDNEDDHVVTFAAA